MKNEIQIAQQENTKLRMFNEIPVELLRLIDKINVILMLEPLSEMEVSILAKFIHQEYKDLTLYEIEDSVYKSKSGRLECNPATYKKLDIDYFGRILTAYRIFKRKENLKKQKQLSHLELEQPKEDIEYEKKMAYEFIDKVFKEENKMPIIANWVKAYDYMLENNLIKVTDSEKLMLKQEVLGEIRANVARLKANGNNFVHLESKLNDKKDIKLQSIRLCIHKYYLNGLYRTV